nr:PTS fructose transporter subunit IIB [Klebsiella aerogenes]
MKGAKALGHNVKVETQGTIGTENELTTEDIAAADVVILAVDVKIKGEERFKNKRIVRVKTEVVIKSPIQFIEKVEKSLANA